MTQQHLHSAGDNDQEHFIGLNELVYLKINWNMYSLFTE
jgi:hypothetical protein